MRVLLRRKLAESIDGVDLSGRKAGDVFDLPVADAQLLIAEQWAIPERRAADQSDRRRQYMSQAGVKMSPLAQAADRSRRSRKHTHSTDDTEER
jgi:hypothetical protein